MKTGREVSTDACPWATGTRTYDAEVRTSNSSSSSRPSGTTTDPESFERVASVVMHPRCINCHQLNFPRQTDSAIRHAQLVVRGRDGHGAQTLPCQACHQTTNTADGRVPGAPGWHLAPLSMVWEGMTRAQICEQLKDPARNGGHRTGEKVIEHMKVDPLVLWAWTPGAGRTPPPLSHERFVEALEAWVQADMPCPTGSGK